MKSRRALLFAVLAVFLLPHSSLSQPGLVGSQTFPADPGSFNQRLKVGPIPGVTGTWHVAPRQAAVPLGTRLLFRLQARSDADIRWEGATEIRRVGGLSIAERTFLETGPQAVTVRYSGLEGGTVLEGCALEVIETPFDQAVLSEIRVSAQPFALNPVQPEDSAMLHFFRDESIAGLRTLEGGGYLTSINRWLDLEVEVQPAGFAPWIEWSLNGLPQRALGAHIRMRVFPARRHEITAGPAGASRSVPLQTYAARIVAPSPGTTIADGVPMTFRAATDPPGFEREITWLAATKHGGAVPLVARGPRFTVWFHDTFGPRTEEGYLPQWLGVRADNAILGRDQTEGPRGGLPIDPEFSATDFTPGPPVASATADPGCAPGQVGIRGTVDANGDGVLDVVGLAPDVGNPTRCTAHPVHYCVEENGGFRVLDDDGAVLDPAFPVPLEAISQGCEGTPDPAACPVLSNGLPPVDCRALAPEADCTTFQLCPDPGAVPDASAEEVFTAQDADAVPPGLTVMPEQRQRAGRLLVVNPCEWSAVNKGFDLLLAEGSPNPYLVQVKRGSDKWNVQLDAGIQRGSARTQRIFHPSLGYQVASGNTISFGITLAGHLIKPLEIGSASEVSECGYKASSDTKVLGSSIEVAAVRRDGGVVREVKYKPLEETVDPLLRSACLMDLEALREREKKANEALHDALIAMAFYNLAGPEPGTKIASREDAQGYLDLYDDAVEEYRRAREAFAAAQRLATPHALDVSLPHLNFEGTLYSVTIPVFTLGPFSCDLEVGATGKLSVITDLINTAAEADPGGCPAIACAADADCGEGSCTAGVCDVPPGAGDACFQARTQADLTPLAGLSAFAYFSAGLRGGSFAGVEGGIRGQLDLAYFQLPVRAEFGLTRVTRPAGTPSLGPPLDSLLADLQLHDGAPPPSIASFTVPYDFGALLEGRFLSGRIDIVARAWALFLERQWKKPLVSWPGITRTWTVAPPATGGANPRPAFLGAGELGTFPDMVTLPKLALADVPGSGDAASIAGLIVSRLGAGHEVENLGLDWLFSNGTASGRCPVRP